MRDVIDIYDKISEPLFLFAAVLLFNIKTEKRRFWWLYFALISIAVFVARYYLDAFKHGGVAVALINSGVMFVLATGLSFACYKNSFADLIYKVILSWIIYKLCRGTPIFFYQAFTAFFIQIEVNFLSFGYWFYKFITVLVIFALSFLLIERKQKLPFTFLRPIPWLLIGVTFIELFVRILEAYFYEIYGPTNQFKLIIAFVSVFVFALSLALVIILYYALQSQKERDGVNRLLAAKSDYYEISKGNIEAINLKCHDLKHQLAALRSGVGAGEFSDSLADMERSVMIYESIAKTGNEPLDVLLTEKSLLCENQGIKFTYMADGGALSFMDTMDVYTMFGNALDNAMEGVMPLPAGELKSISMTIARRGDFLDIRIENTCANDILLENGNIKTTKFDKDNHGFGLKSIRMIAEKYRGSINVTARAGLFSLTIIIPLK